MEGLSLARPAENRLYGRINGIPRLTLDEPGDSIDSFSFQPI